MLFFIIHKSCYEKEKHKNILKNQQIHVSGSMGQTGERLN